jgi:Tetratricopeptide repeat
VLDLLHWTCDYLAKADRSPRALGPAETAATIATERLGPGDPRRLDARIDLASGYLWAGRYDDAVNAAEAVAADCEQELGPGHESTLKARNNLAGCYRSSMRLAEAIGVFESLVADLEREPGQRPTVSTW